MYRARQPHPHHPGQQPQQRGWPAVLARWPSGDEPPSARPDGGATVAWRDQSHNKIEAGDVRMGRTRAGEAAAPPDDPFSIVGTPGLGGGRGAGEYDPLPAISESDRYVAVRQSYVLVARARMPALGSGREADAVRRGK